jgi:hypothetical protein
MGGDADGEFASLTVDDRSAPAPDLDDLLVLAPRLRSQRVGFEHLELPERARRPRGPLPTGPRRYE